jgi:hypothetical protein
MKIKLNLMRSFNSHPQDGNVVGIVALRDGEVDTKFGLAKGEARELGVEVIGDGVEKNSGPFIGDTVSEHGIDNLLDIVLDDVGVPGQGKGDAPIAWLTSGALGAAKPIAGGTVPRAIKLIAKGYGLTSGVVSELMLAELNGHD